MSHSNPPIELELQLQYRGELASTITHIKPEGRDARTPLLMGIFDSHLNVLTLNKVEPRMKEVVWGNGQMRARWVLKRGSVSAVFSIKYERVERIYLTCITWMLGRPYTDGHVLPRRFEDDCRELPHINVSKTHLSFSILYLFAY